MKKLLVGLTLVTSMAAFSSETIVLTCNVSDFDSDIQNVIVVDNYSTGVRSHYLEMNDGSRVLQGAGIPRETQVPNGKELSELPAIANKYEVKLGKDLFRLGKNNYYSTSANKWIFDKIGDYSDYNSNSVECY